MTQAFTLLGWGFQHPEFRVVSARRTRMHTTPKNSDLWIQGFRRLSLDDLFSRGMVSVHNLGPSHVMVKFIPDPNLEANINDNDWVAYAKQQAATRWGPQTLVGEGKTLTEAIANLKEPS